jgi:hypothetical protein
LHIETCINEAGIPFKRFINGMGAFKEKESCTKQIGLGAKDMHPF